MLKNSFNNAIAQYHLLDAGDVVLVMVSGGGDSVALLRLLEEHKDELSLKHLSAFHYNHGLREKESDEDEQFVQKLCDSLGIELHVAGADVGAYAEEHKLNLEDAGRILRYEAANKRLLEIADELDLHRQSPRLKLATAHSLDDRVETFFSRTISGSGLGALGSIRPKRGNIVRPLIGATRDEIRDWLLVIKQYWREDKTNEDTTRTRAFIREYIVSAAQELNPNFKQSLERTLDIISEEDALLDNMAEMFARDFSEDVVPGDHLGINLNFFRTLEPAMQRRTLRYAIIKTFPDLSRLEHAHIVALLDALNNEGFVHDLPQSLRAKRVSSTLWISKKREREEWRDMPILRSGEFDLGTAGKLVLEESNNMEIITNNPDVAVIDADTLLGNLSVGPQREGERINPLGMEGSKLISDVFIDAKYPREERAFVPVVRDGQLVVWVGGHTLSDLYKVTEETTSFIKMTWHPRKD